MVTESQWPSALKRLEWQHYQSATSPFEETWTASTVFGSIYVDQDEDLSWKWRYCFDEYYDEGQEGCESAADGKAKAEAFYLSRISPALVGGHSWR